MHSVFILVCCVALFCSALTLPEDDSQVIRPPVSLEHSFSDILSEPKVDEMPTIDEKVSSAIEPLYGSTTSYQEELTTPTVSAAPVNSTSDSALEELVPDLENTWAISDEGTGEQINSEIVHANPTATYMLPNSANSQQATSTRISQTSPVSYESVLYTNSTPIAYSTPNSLDPTIISGTVQHSIEATPAITQASPIINIEPSASVTTASTADTVALTQLDSLTSSMPHLSSSAYGVYSSSDSGFISTGSEKASTPTQTVTRATATSAPYFGFDSRPSNSTLPTTSHVPISDQGTSSAYDIFSTTSYLDSSRVIQSTATLLSTSKSILNTTQTISTTPYPLTSSSIMSPIPSANSSTTAYTSSFSITMTSSTSIYLSTTSSYSLAPITINTTSTYSPGSSTITIPLLTSTFTLPPQSSSLSSNSTYTLSPPSNSTSSYSPFPSSTQTSVMTTIPTIIVPTATNTASTFIPSSIIAQTSSTYTSGQSTSQATGIPSALPKIVQNPLSSSIPVQPVDTSEVQIGFEWALNYPFVVSHPLSTSQIFTYLPIGIADGLGLDQEQIIVKNLLPLDTTAELQFITTVARVFIPTSMVDTLRIDLGIAASPIYQNQDESVATLMNYINPAVPFFPGAVLDPGATPTGKDGRTAQNTTPGDAGVFNTAAQQPQSPSAKGTTAGIALAACGGAAAYGAAMFLLARRYKHRQQRHKRPVYDERSSDSIEGEPRSFSPGPFGNGTPLMSGGRISPEYHRHSRGSGRTGNTTRNAQISGPMMAENSLGWN